MDNITNDCKKYLGLPPYDDFTNICYRDVHYFNSLCVKYGEDAVTAKLRELRETYARLRNM